MNLNAKIKCLLKRKLATAVFITASSAAAFATLGDGGGKPEQRGYLYASRPANFSSRDFSLRSGYNYRTNNLFTSNTPQKEKFVLLNTVTTIQRGNTTYIMPLKKKVILDKVKFNPAPNRF
jgi:hypothetical protein